MLAMYAVIKTGGKQYRVAKDDVIIVERLAGDAGDKIELDQVLLLDDGKGPTLGTPLVDGARVVAAVLDQSRADKIIVFKKKRRKNYRRTLGHRQDQTVLRITDILAKGQKAKTTRARKKADDEKPAPEAEAEAAEATEATATEAPPEAATEAAPEAAPEAEAKPAPRRRATRAKKEDAGGDEEAKEAAPKRKRAAKPKAEADDTAGDAAADDAGDEGKPEEKS
jgi:large subunit ribosomal protein L21